jgi:hypothetical protein
MPGDHPDPDMAEREQVPRRQHASLVVVDPDAGMLAAAAPHLNDRHPRGLHQPPGGVGTAAPDEHEAVDPMGEQLVDGGVFAGRVVLVGGDEQLEARLRQGALHFLERRCEDRAVERRDHHAHRARPPRGQRARRAVRPVAEPLGDRAHPFERLGAQ